MNEDGLFSQKYFKELIESYGYDIFDFERINFTLGILSVRELDRRFLCHHQGDVFAKNLLAKKKSIVTTGFGLSGIPHLGTISAILKIVDLQRGGISTQIVLGDLDAYNARNQPLESVRERVGIYKQFICSLGYQEKVGIIRDQFNALEVLRTAFIVCKYLDDKDFLEAEEDLASLYKKEGVYLQFSFPMKLALLLMVADFLNLILNDGYENVLVSLGIEEHKYVLLARKVVDRMGLNAQLSALYGKLIPGLNGYPKMSKSIKGSGITVETSDEEVETNIRLNATCSTIPEENPVFKMMAQASLWSTAELDVAAYALSSNDSYKWNTFCEEYIEQLKRILRCWPKCK